MEEKRFNEWHALIERYNAVAKELIEKYETIIKEYETLQNKLDEAIKDKEKLLSMVDNITKQNNKLEIQITEDEALKTELKSKLDKANIVGINYSRLIDHTRQKLDIATKALLKIEPMLDEINHNARYDGTSVYKIAKDALAEIENKK